MNSRIFWKFSKQLTALILCIVLTWTGTELIHVAASNHPPEPPPPIEAEVPLEEQLSSFLDEKVDVSNAIGIYENQDVGLNELAVEKSDGSVDLYFFSEPIKYEDENGVIKFKETTIQEQNDTSAAREGYDYTNGENDIDINFSADVDTGIKIKADENELTLTPVQSNEVEKQEGSTKEITNLDDQTEDAFVYEGVFGEGTRVEYTPQMNGLKENIVLDEYVGVNTFDFILNTNGDNATLIDGKIVEIKDQESGATINTLLPLFAYDSHEDAGLTESVHYTEDCTYTLTAQDNGTYLLTVTVSEEWLTSPTTVYPVTIDPTVSTTTGADAALYSKKATANHRNITNCVGYDSTQGVGRSLFMFSTPSIPDYSTVNSAHYYLRETTGKTGTAKVGIHRIKEGWDNTTVTWNTQPTHDIALSTKNINSASTDLSSSPYWYAFDIKSDVQSWVNNAVTHRGYKLIAQNETSTNAVWRAFASIRHTTTGYRPYGKISYTEDTTAPTYTSISGNPTAWTNKKVKLTINGAADSASGLHATPYSFSTSSTNSWGTSKTSIEYANATVYAKIRDKVGNAKSATVTINKVDLTKPKITSVTGNPTTWTNQDVTLTVNATDTGSGVSKYYYSGVSSTAKTHTVKSNKTVEIYATDVATNPSETIVSVVVSKIDKVKPVISSVATAPIDGQPGKIRVTINATDALSGISGYSFNGSTYQAAKYKDIDSNDYDSLIIKVKDNAGNITTQGELPDPVDVTPPTIALSTSNSYAQSVTIHTEIADSESGVETVKWAVGNQTVSYFASSGTVLSRDSFIVNQSGTYTVYAVDSAGNERVKTVNVSLATNTIAQPSFTENNGNLTITYPNQAEKMLYREGTGQWTPYQEPIVIKEGIKVYARAFVGDVYAENTYTPTVSSGSVPLIYEKDGLINIMPSENRNTMNILKSYVGSWLSFDGEWDGNNGRQLNMSSSTALASPAIDHDEATYTEASFTVPDNAVNSVFSFYYNLSTEEGKDKLSVYLDGSEEPVFTASGEKDWTLKEIPLTPGEHMIKFEYSKDEETHGGLDQAFLDDFILTYEMPGNDQIQYKIDDSEYYDYDGPFEIERSEDVTVYAKDGNSQVIKRTFVSPVGSFTLEYTDMQIESPGLTISFDRYYDSKPGEKSGFGSNWKFSHDSKIEDFEYQTSGGAESSNWRIKKVYQLDGTTTDFVLGTDGKYTSLQTKDTLAVYEDRIVMTTPEQYKYVFNTVGQLTSIVDNNGNITTFSKSGNTLTITDCVGRQYIVTYNNSGQVTNIADPMQNIVQYQYNNEGNLAAVIDQANVTVNQYLYSDNRISQIKNAMNVAEQTISYNGAGLLSGVQYANGSGKSYSYANNSIAVGDQNALESSVVYDNQMRLIQSVDEDNKTTDYTYTEDALTYTESESVEGKLTQYVYEKKTDNLLSVFYPEVDSVIPTELYTYDNQNRVIREKSVDNTYTYYTYDGNGNILVTAILYSSVLETGQIAPDSFGQASAAVREKMEVSTNVYGTTPIHNIYGLVEHEHNGDSCTAYTYNQYGQVQKSTSRPLEDGGHGDVTSETTNIINAIEQLYSATTVETSVDTDENDNAVTKTETTLSSYLYDEVGRILRKKTVITDAENMSKTEVTRHIFDICGREIQTIGKDQYVAADDGLNSTPPVNIYANQNVGERKMYKQNGDLQKEIDEQNRETIYVYDNLGNLTTKTMPNGSVLTYDTRQRTTLEVFANNVFSRNYTYTTSHQVSAVTGTNYSDSYTYDGDDADAKITSTTSQYGTASAVTTDYTYTRENISTITVDNTEKIRYTYGEHSELLREDNQYLNNGNGQTIAYAYDADGNILSKKVYAYTLDADLTGKNATTISYDYSMDEEKKNFITSYNGNTITSDDDGNFLTYNGWTYTWNGEGKLTTMAKTGTSISFTYNDDGIRTSTTVNGVTTTYTLDGDKVVTETTGSQVLDYTYDSNDNIVMMTVGGQNYFYKRNIQNDVTDLLDSDMNVVASYTYDTWGKLISVTGNTTLGNLNPYRYRGYRYDAETGMYYLQSRYYEPELGRFISPDSIEDTGYRPWGKNKFAYCNNNPVMYIDPTGHLAWIFKLLKDLFPSIGKKLYWIVSALWWWITNGPTLEASSIRYQRRFTTRRYHLRYRGRIYRFAVYRR